MRGTKASLTIVAAALLLVLPSCTSNSLDDGDSADVVLEVVELTNEPVSGTDSGAGCQFEITDWQATLENKPKNSLAGASPMPFNDIVVVSVLVSYDWIDCASCSTVDRFVGLGDVAIPAGLTGTVSFAPIAFDDLLAGLPDIEGSTANLTLMFTARTVEGTIIQERVFRQLFVETCATE